jgi:hypothetical protein
MTPEKLANETLRLLSDEPARSRMRTGLAAVKEKLSSRAGAPQRAAAAIQDILEGQVAHV